MLRCRDSVAFVGQSLHRTAMRKENWKRDGVHDHNPYRKQTIVPKDFHAYQYIHAAHRTMSTGIDSRSITAAGRAAVAAGRGSDHPTVAPRLARR